MLHAAFRGARTFDEMSDDQHGSLIGGKLGKPQRRSEHLAQIGSRETRQDCAREGPGQSRISKGPGGPALLGLGKEPSGQHGQGHFSTGFVGTIRAIGQIDRPSGIGVPVAKVVRHLSPIARILRTVPMQCSDGFCGVVDDIHRCSVPPRWLHPWDKGQGCLRQATFEGPVIPVQTVRNHCPKGYSRLPCSTDQVHFNLRLGAKGRIRLAVGQARSRGVGDDIEGIVDVFIRSEAADRNDTILGRAEHTIFLHPRRWIALKCFQAALIDPLLILGRLRQEGLPAQHLSMLSTSDRLGTDEGGQGLVPIRGNRRPCR